MISITLPTIAAAASTLTQQKGGTLSGDYPIIEQSIAARLLALASNAEKMKAIKADQSRYEELLAWRGICNLFGDDASGNLGRDKKTRSITVVYTPVVCGANDKAIDRCIDGINWPKDTTLCMTFGDRSVPLMAYEDEDEGDCLITVPGKEGSNVPQFMLVASVKDTQSLIFPNCWETSGACS